MVIETRAVVYLCSPRNRARYRHAILRYAEDRGVHIEHIYEEPRPPQLLTRPGISGMQRPMLVRMLGRLHSGSIQVVLVSNYQALSRSLVAQEVLRAYFATLGISIWALNGDPDEKRGAFSVPVRAQVREAIETYVAFARANLGHRLHGARTAKHRREDSHYGQEPYGSQNDEMRNVAEMRRLRAEGLAYRAIADRLNALQITPRRGTKWFANSVRRILCRPL